MIVTLFFKECRQVLKSPVYYMFLVIFVLFITSQMGDTTVVQKPLPGQESYGVTETVDEGIIMRTVLKKLHSELGINRFATYPVGFYKEVTLSQEELERAKEILAECTGKSWEQLSSGSAGAEARDGLSYEAFAEKMEELCRIIGGGSSYERKNYESDAKVPMSYEEALAEYGRLLEFDGITGAYMRLFCDYSGIMLALLPIFVGAAGAVRDKRAKSTSVIHAKSASSFSIVISRYAANLVMMITPVLLMAFVMEMPYIYQAGTLGANAKVFAFAAYTLGWLLPTVMFVLSGAFFLSLFLPELFGGVAAMVVQVAFAMAMLLGQVGLMGKFGLNMVPRWNEFGFTGQFERELGELIQNRIFYGAAALVLLAAATLIYDLRRKGGFEGRWTGWKKS